MDDPFRWHELRVADPEEAARFYGALLGWEFRPTPGGLSIEAGGAVIGGVSAVKPEVPAHWAPYVECEDADAAAAAAVAAGGTVTTGRAVDVPGVGRLAPILDPEKSIVVAVSGPGRQPVERAPGRFVWERLRTGEPAAALTFHTAVFGVRGVLADDEGSAVLETDGGRRVAELVAPGLGEPTGWLSFVLVEDLEAAWARAVDLGGTADGDVATGGHGHHRLITDTQGVALALHEDRT